MKTNRIYILIVVLLITILFTGGCGRGKDPVDQYQPGSTPDVNATINAAVAATNSTQSPDLNATVNAAVAATASAQPPDVNATVNAAVGATAMAEAGMQATIDVAVAATSASVPAGPTPTIVNVDNITEEELTQIVEAAVADAYAAIEDVSTAASDASSDGNLTQEEIETIEVYINVANAEIDQALALADKYLSIYSELAAETIVLLNEVEQDLESLESYATEIETLLLEMSASIQQGQVIAQETIDKMNTKAKEATTKAEEAKSQASNWVENTKSGLENRENKYSNVQPDKVANDRLGAINISRDYIDSVRNSLVDGQVSRQEMDQIAQLGANASASLNTLKNPEYKNHSDSINSLTRNLSRGEMPQARSSLGELDRSFPQRGSR